MLFKFLFIFVLQLLILIDATTARRRYNDYHSSRGHKSGHRSRDRGSWKRKHPTIKSAVMTPTEKYFNFVSPPYVKHWTCAQKSKLIDLLPTAKEYWQKKEYNIVKTDFESTWGPSFTGHQVLKIQKIFNTCLWKRYQFSRQTIVHEVGKKKIREQLLYHGSPAAMTLVDKGFDERYAKNGWFGYGVYFASSSSMSDGYTPILPDGTKLILLCRVNLGKPHVVTALGSYPHPPAGFHSVIGELAQRELIVYRGEQAYPEFLITYK